MAIQTLSGFFAQYKLLTYKKREMILRADTPPVGVFYLEKGYVRDYSISVDGEELTLVVFKPGDFFPIQWAISNKPNSHNMEAMTEISIRRAPKEEFVAFLKTNPDVLFESTRQIVIRLGGLLDRMEHLVFGNAYQKIASILVIFAERFGEEVGKSTTVPIPLTHKEIANISGITRETVSIEMKKLEKKQLISYKGSLVTIKDMKGLIQESSVERSDTW